MHLSGIEIFFLICAVTGGIFVLVRMIMLFIGVSHDFTQDFSTDAGGGDFHADHGDSDSAFKMVSVHGLTSFLMMFGLVGFAMYRESKLGVFISLLGAVAAGLGTVWIIGKLFALIYRMQSSGTIATASAVGAQGKVYLRIPEQGSGRVLVHVKNSMREYDAFSADHQEISTGTAIRVVRVDGDSLIVERI